MPTPNLPPSTLDSLTALGSNDAQPLPSRHEKASTINSLWPVHLPSPPPPLLANEIHNDLSLETKCEAAPGDTCCRDSKGSDDRTLIDPAIIRDIVIGLSDGLTVPFALTAGLSGLGQTRIVVLGGVAELVAGAISMGVGGFLASKAELDHFRYLRKQTHERVLRSCNGEMERAIHGFLGPVGVEEPLTRLITENLRKVETAQAGSWDETHQHSRWWKLGFGKVGKEERGAGTLSHDAGITGFLLKGENCEEVPQSRLYISAFTIGISYLLGGLCPLIPYFIVHNNINVALIWSTGVTLFILLLFGVAKTHFSGAAGGWKGYAWGAVSTMLVGGLAAGAAFGLVRLIGA